MKTLSAILGFAALGLMLWVLWTFKWWIIGGSLVVAFFNLLCKKVFGFEFIKTEEEK